MTRLNFWVLFILIPKFVRSYWTVESYGLQIDHSVDRLELLYIIVY